MAAARRLCRRCKKPLSKQRIAKRKWYCHLCELANRREASERAHDRRVAVVYGLEPGEYQILLAAQDGRCPVCLRATGRSKRLSVDHDHRLTGRDSVRGLICSTCNKMLGHARDDPDFFRRAIAYLLNPPARRVLK